MFKKGMACVLSMALLLNMSFFPCNNTASTIVNNPSIAYAATVPVINDIDNQNDELEVTVSTCLDEEPVIYDFEDEHDDSYHEEVVEEPSPEALKASAELINPETDGLDEEELEEENNIKDLLKYTEDDLYILAHIISGEAQYCDETEQKYVGSVFLNRVNSSRFPNTFKEVAFQKKQYACTWDGNYKKEPTEQNWAVAKWLLENGSDLPANVVFQAQFKQGAGTYIKTKYHYYCYIE